MIQWAAVCARGCGAPTRFSFFSCLCWGVSQSKHLKSMGASCYTADVDIDHSNPVFQDTLKFSCSIPPALCTLDSWSKSFWYSWLLANKNSILKVWIGYKKTHRFELATMEGTVSGYSVYTVSPSRNRYLMSTPAPPLSAPPGCWETGSPPAMSHVWQVPFMLAETQSYWKSCSWKKNTCFDLFIH